MQNSAWGKMTLDQRKAGLMGLATAIGAYIAIGKLDTRRRMLAHQQAQIPPYIEYGKWGVLGALAVTSFALRKKNPGLSNGIGWGGIAGFMGGAIRELGRSEGNIESINELFPPTTTSQPLPPPPIPTTAYGRIQEP